MNHTGLWLTADAAFAQEIRPSLRYLLAVVEDDGAVRPAVVIHQTQVREKSNSDRLKTPLITHSEAIAVNLENHRFNFTSAAAH